METDNFGELEAGLRPYIPWDKSWLMRMGVLDLLQDEPATVDFLAQEDDLSEDLVALKLASEAWRADQPVTVGESGTLYRFLLFASWQRGLDKRFVTSGTLVSRPVTEDPGIVDLPQSELLALDDGTSQWASAAVLCGDRQRLPDAPYKLALTYQAVDHWENQRAEGISWQPRHDSTIARQAGTYFRLLCGEAADFHAEQAEDFCFDLAYQDYTHRQEPAREFSSLTGHETNRLVEMPAALEHARAGRAIGSPDHRVVQAAAMWARLSGVAVEFVHLSAVNKSWPRFWEFMAAADEQMLNSII